MTLSLHHSSFYDPVRTETLLLTTLAKPCNSVVLCIPVMHKTR